MMTRIMNALMASTVALSACGREQESSADAAADQPQAEIRAADSTGMAGMPGMADGAPDPMTTHMEMMGRLPADSMMAMLPEHRQMAANMVAQMNRDMTGMNMTGDAAWTATVDSLRNDLTRMPDMTATELQAFTPAHQDRLRRLMAMHRAMMGGM